MKKFKNHHTITLMVFFHFSSLDFLAFRRVSFSFSIVHQMTQQLCHEMNPIVRCYQNIFKDVPCSSQNMDLISMVIFSLGSKSKLVFDNNIITKIHSHFRSTNIKWFLLRNHICIDLFHFSIIL